MESGGVVRLFMVAGEASADLHAASLVRELKKLSPELSLIGVGGSRLVGEGLKTVVPAESLNVVGLSDWMAKAPEIWRSYQKILHSFASESIDAAVLLDLPDLNLRLAQRLKKRNVPVAYYISPQVWAWRKDRIHTIRHCIDKMLVLFPFEKAFYEKEGVPVDFVGHPLVDSISPRPQYRSGSEIRSAPQIALLPGSRLSEVKYHAPLLSDVARRIKAQYPLAQFKVPVAPTLSVKTIREKIPLPFVELTSAPAQEIYAWADIAAVASGTATLEATLVGTPFALFYKMSFSTELLVRHWFRYRGFLGITNWLHYRKVVEELTQERATGEAIAGELVRLVEDDSYRRRMIASLRETRGLLGHGGASRRAAEKLLEWYQAKKA